MRTGTYTLLSLAAIWLLAGVLVGCSKTQDAAPSTGVTAAPTPSPEASTAPSNGAGEDAAPEPEGDKAEPSADAENIGNGKNESGDYVCPVSGDALSSLDSELSVEYNGKTYYFCCAGCPPEFEKDPDKYVDQIASGETPEGTHMAHPDESHEGRDHTEGRTE